MRSLAFDMVKYRLQIVRSTSIARHSDIRQKRREAVREAEEERRGGRGGRLRGSVAAGDAVRGGGEGGAAGGGDAVPDADPSARNNGRRPSTRCAGIRGARRGGAAGDRGEAGSYDLADIGGKRHPVASGRSTHRPQRPDLPLQSATASQSRIRAKIS